MKVSDEMKRQVLQEMEAAHHAKARGLLARLRICHWSFKTMAMCWRHMRAAPFLSIADAEAFDAEAAEAFVENADAMIAELAGVPREDVVVIRVLQTDECRFIGASLGEGPEPPALAALVDADDEARLIPIRTDRTWQRGADGKLRLRRSQAAAPESGARMSGGEEIDAH